MFFAWHVGAVLLVIIGVAKSLVRRWDRRCASGCRAGLLGSLAGIALALIALVPLWENIASLPLVGMVTLVFILVTLVAHHPLPGRVPGALAAVGLGAVLYWALVKLGPALNVTLVPPPSPAETAAWGLPEFLPAFAQKLAMVAKCLRPRGDSVAGHAAVCAGDGRRRHRLHGKRRGRRR